MSRSPSLRALKVVRGYRCGLDALSVDELQPELREARAALVRLERKAQALVGPTARQRRETI